MASQLNDAHRWFARMFGVACVAHIVGNPPVGEVGPETTALGVTTLALGLISVSLIVRPDLRRLLGAAGLVIVSVWLEAPLLGNHWLVMGFVALAVLASGFSKAPWPALAPMGRVVLLVFYSFAAFAKLNAGFFDAVHSCGVFYANQALGSYGLRGIEPGGTAALAVIVGTAAIELAVPILLVIPRTRRWGVLLGVAFHSLISLDLDQHFYDFTAVLLLLFGLFHSDETSSECDRRAAVETRSFQMAVATTVLLVLAAVVPETTVTVVLLRIGAFVVWIPFAIWFVWTTATVGRSTADLRLVPRSAFGAALAAIVFLNGLTPYLELKTAYGFNMYANLETVGGESNHFVVRRTLPLTGVHDDLVAIDATDDPGLEPYVNSGYVLPRRNLDHYLADHPDASVEATTLAGTSMVIEGDTVEALPVLAEKFQLFRAVDTRDPPRCQAAWFPAR